MLNHVKKRFVGRGDEVPCILVFNISFTQTMQPTATCTDTRLTAPEDCMKSVAVTSDILSLLSLRMLSTVLELEDIIALWA